MLEGLGLLANITVLIAALAALDKASDLTITQSINVASVTRLGKTTVGFILVAFGTSVPELSTSIGAVKKGHSGLALGNIIGSCFMNITLILGITLVTSLLNINMNAFSNIALFSLVANLLLWYFLSNERIGRREGTVLLFLYTLFIAISLGIIQFA